MLSQLSIKHYALIENLDLQPGKGLNILTGETGSGKSIILGALGLLLGERADMRAVQEGKNKCIVEAVFHIEGMDMQGLFEIHDLDYDAHSTLRREILATGKSRAFVNDTPVNLKVLREIGMKLIDIHSQHQTLQINDPRYQLNVLDTFAGSAHEMSSYQAAYAKYVEARHALEAAIVADQKSRQNLDFVRFQLKELEAAGLEGVDAQELEEELNLLSNADEIAGGLGKSVTALSDDERGASLALRMAIEGLSPLRPYARQYEELYQRLKSAEIELNDVAADLESLLSKVDVDPQRLAKLEALQGKIFALEQKHGVLGVEALRELCKQLQAQVEGVDHFDERLEELRNEERTARDVAVKAAALLSAKRKSVAGPLARSIAELLSSLNMPQAKLELKMEALPEPGANGMDKVAFYFSANAGQKPAPLKDVASGGELSRLMLAIKRLTARNAGRSTIVFDEIDTGVSGEVAHSMGRIMRGMAEGLQVICISHLPQIAAKGSTHFRVFKEIRDGRSITDIALLDKEARVNEIAQMLSGAKTTEAALTNARELLAQG
jgi:DNA repair protein RecN (Recombination protein N)